MCIIGVSHGWDEPLAGTKLPVSAFFCQGHKPICKKEAHNG